MRLTVLFNCMSGREVEKIWLGVMGAICDVDEISGGQLSIARKECGL